MSYKEAQWINVQEKTFTKWLVMSSYLYEIISSSPSFSN